MLQSEYDVIVRHQRLKVLLIILTSITVALVLYAAIKVGREQLSSNIGMRDAVHDTDTPPKSSPEPTKTEFAERFPTDFPADIPVEKDVKFTQSYTLDYPGQKQLTVVFDSAKTIKENYTFYQDFLEKNDWNIINSSEDGEISFLYGTKESMDMNVTITPITPGSVIPKQDTDETEDGSMDGFPDKDTASVPAQSLVSVSVLRK